MFFFQLFSLFKRWPAHKPFETSTRHFLDQTPCINSRGKALHLPCTIIIHKRPNYFKQHMKAKSGTGSAFYSWIFSVALTIKPSLVPIRYRLSRPGSRLLLKEAPCRGSNRLCINQHLNKNYTKYNRQKMVRKEQTRRNAKPAGPITFCLSAGSVRGSGTPCLAASAFYCRSRNRSETVSKDERETDHLSSTFVHKCI